VDISALTGFFGRQPRIRARKRVFLQPPQPGEKVTPWNWQRGGVFSAAGLSDPELALEMKDCPPLPLHRRDDALELPGDALFGGMMKAHFGDFLCESIGRLWALQDRAADLPLVYLAASPGEFDRAATAKAFFALFGIANPVAIITDTTLVSRLLLASNLYHPITDGPLQPHLRQWLHQRRPPQRSDLGDNLYLSRRGVPPRKGHLLGEAFLERGLRDEGYAIMRPETLPLAEQIDAIAGARRIVLSESSAFHLVPLFARPDAIVALVQRRQAEMPGIRNTFASFTSQQVHSVTALRRIWADRAGGRLDNYRALGEADFGLLWQELARHRLVGSATGKPIPSQDEIALERERLGGRQHHRNLPGRRGPQ